MQTLSFEKSGLTKGEWQILKNLSTPKKVQDYLNKLPFNHELRGETHRSVRETLRAKEAHCLEGAFLAAAAFWIHGGKPLILDLKVVRPDLDHFVTLFKKDGFWGAVSKTNHSVLRYREPVYRDIRELAMSYFHEYFLNDGTKTLRSYSDPFDLRIFGTEWLTSGDNLAWMAHEIDQSKHHKILTDRQIRNLRKADKVEREAAMIVEYKK